MNTPTWLEYVSALGSIATPLLIAVAGIIGWRFRSRLERRFALEDKLREDRVEIYLKILEPYVILLMSQAAWTMDPKHKNKDKDQVALMKIASIDYRRDAFRLSLMGSDAVVKAHNDLFQYFYTNAEGHDPFEIMKLLGTFLLEIRRSMGSPDTRLDELDMVEWFLTDARKYRKGVIQA